MTSPYLLFSRTKLYCVSVIKSRFALQNVSCPISRQNRCCEILPVKFRTVQVGYNIRHCPRKLCPKFGVMFICAKLEVIP